ASPAAWLSARGHTVTCLDLSRQALDEESIRGADLIAFHLPMHTATRLAAEQIERVRRLNPHAHICCYGLYAPMNQEFLRALGVVTILGGEFENGLADLADRLADASERMKSRASGIVPGERGGRAAQTEPNIQPEPTISMARQEFLVPQRADLPALDRYARLQLPGGEEILAGYTEASRGCKHLCRHCPIVPVYNGTFRVVGREIVLADVRQQVAVGARHVTFGDPDFFNGPTHGLAIVRAMHREFPGVTYDVTIKIEHLLKHPDLLPELRDTGCLFVTSAVESVDDAILDRLDKGHTRADFLAVAQNFRELDLVLQPTFVPFTPWTTVLGYRDLLRVIAENNFVANVPPIQLAIRLLIPAGSRLLELPEVRELVQPFDRAGLAYPWLHADPRVDLLGRRVQQIVEQGEAAKLGRAQIFAAIWKAAAEADGISPDEEASTWQPPPSAQAAVPHFDEAWYCCAEPAREQFVTIGVARPAAVASKEPVVRTTPSAIDGFV
ncbi:MAG: CUAEP/CCAEP-tail radical SAM protein, partial [Candidatus Acidiferrales bacterium]